MDHITLISAFRQGTVVEGGNCASIALIKAAMHVYGEHVFAEYRFDGTTHHAVLRDHTPLQFTQVQVERAAKRADFHLRRGEDAGQTARHKAILAKAHVYFCAMVVRVMQIGEADEGAADGIGDDFDDAIIALNDGADTEHIPDLLGLPHTVATKPWTSTRVRGGVVAWSPERRHAVFAAHGDYDHYGDVRRLGTNFRRRLFIGA